MVVASTAKSIAAARKRSEDALKATFSMRVRFTILPLIISNINLPAVAQERPKTDFRPPAVLSNFSYPPSTLVHQQPVIL
jgi:hypothetical protein